jgi:hypothetical protein
MFYTGDRQAATHQSQRGLHRSDQPDPGYMEGTRHLLIDYEYFIIHEDEVLQSGKVPAFLLGNARAFIKLRHTNILDKYKLDDLKIRLRRIANPDQTAFPFITKEWSGI